MCKLIIYTSLPVEDVECIVNKYFVAVELYDGFEIENAFIFTVGYCVISLFDLEAIQNELKELDMDITSTCIQVML